MVARSWCEAQRDGGSDLLGFHPEVQRLVFLL